MIKNKMFGFLVITLISVSFALIVSRGDSDDSLKIFLIALAYLLIIVIFFQIKPATIEIAEFLEPQILLMDEPLANLDVKLKSKIREQIKELIRQFSVTIIYVTHDLTQGKNKFRPSF